MLSWQHPCCNPRCWPSCFLLACQSLCPRFSLLPACLTRLSAFPLACLPGCRGGVRGGVWSAPCARPGLNPADLVRLPCLLTCLRPPARMVPAPLASSSPYRPATLRPQFIQHLCLKHHRAPSSHCSQPVLRLPASCLQGDVPGWIQQQRRAVSWPQAATGWPPLCAISDANCCC